MRNGSTFDLAAQISPGRFEKVAGFAQLQAARIHLEHLQAPAEGRGETQRAVVIEPAVVEIACGHAGRDADEAFGLFGGGEQLRQALIGEAVHADAAVALGAGAEPGDGLGSVLALVAEGIELAFGVAASANILDDDVVSVAREPDWDARRRRSRRCRVRRAGA